MKLIFLIILIFSFSFAANCQQVLPVKTADLMSRVHNNSDTVYIVNFWATWCGPCVKELPAFEQLNNKFKNAPLKIILVSVDFRSLLEKKVVPFVRQKKMKAEVVLLDEKDQQAYINQTDSSWSGAIPATLIVKGNKRKFAEHEFTYAELLQEYQSFIKP
jgi:thiol-disulfide isomerase/thioredoxin